MLSLASERFAREVGASARKRILLELDRTGWHSSNKKLRASDVNSPSCVLPSHSPELRPAERLRPLSDEGMASPCFEGIESLKETLIERCASGPMVIRSYTRYHC